VYGRLLGGLGGTHCRPCPKIDAGEGALPWSVDSVKSEENSSWSVDGMKTWSLSVDSFNFANFVIHNYNGHSVRMAPGRPRGWRYYGFSSSSESGRDGEVSEEVDSDDSESSSSSSSPSQDYGSEGDGLRADTSARIGLVREVLSRPSARPSSSPNPVLGFRSLCRSSVCCLQAPERRDRRWIRAQTFCDSYYPARSAFEASPLTKNRVDGVEVPTCLSEREWLVARMVLNSNRDEGKEYVEKLRDEDFVYHSRDEVRRGLCMRHPLWLQVGTA
jgi:hypothetical protein